MGGQMSRWRKKRTGRENTPSLPAEITRIAPQKRRNDRYSLYHEDRFLIGVSRESLTEFELKEGEILTEDQYKSILLTEERRAAKEYLIRLLARRDHSRNELETKALKKGFDREMISPALEQLENSGYLNEEEFAEKYACDQLRFHQWGPLKIRNGLIRKGVTSATVDKVLSKLSDDWELEKICVDLAVKRKRHFSREEEKRKRRDKVAAYLLRKGFTYEIIQRTLPEIIRKLNAD